MGWWTVLVCAGSPGQLAAGCNSALGFLGKELKDLGKLVEMSYKW